MLGLIPFPGTAVFGCNFDLFSLLDSLWFSHLSAPLLALSAGLGESFDSDLHTA